MARTLNMPVDNEQATVHLKPLEEIEVNGLNFDNVKVDILGPDIILRDPNTGGKIVFPGLGLTIFDEAQAPQITLADGSVLTGQMMLQRIGKIENVAEQDFLTFTSLKVDEESGAEDDKTGFKEDTEEIEEEDTKDAAAELANLQVEVQELKDQLEEAQQRSNPNEEDVPEESNVESLVESQAEFIDSASGALPALPQPPASPSSPDQASEEDPGDTTTDGAVTTFSFTTTFLQLASSEALETFDSVPNTRVIRGGGASEVGAFDDRSVSQFSTEIIAVQDDTTDMAIYADDPNSFGPGMMSRTLQFTPSLPDEFDVTEIVITGLPAGFTIVGETAVGGVYTITNPTLTADGTIELTIQYTDLSAQTFTLDIDQRAEYTGVGSPTITEFNESASAVVEVKAVNSAADFDPGTGIDFVLANNANANQIFTGSGNVTVFGGEGVDTITSSTGDDTIYTGAGDDVIISNEGDDEIFINSGNNTIVADNGTLDTGNDTLNYSQSSTGISVDLSVVVSGNSTVTHGSDSDTISGIENITGSTGNDTITGDNEINILNGGDGNDTIMGRGGNDTLNGGGGTNTLNYSYVSSGITINLNSGTVNAGAGDVDTISNFQNTTGGSGNDTITGTSSANTLSGGAGGDTISAGDGNDTVLGGSGNDIIVAGTGDDTIDGGSNTDTLNYSARSEDITLDLSDLSHNISGTNYAIATVGVGGEQDFVRQVENITGSSGNNDIIGDNNNNQITGQGGDDQFAGGDGDDTLSGGAGNDQLDGGSGDDILLGGTGSNTFIGGTDTGSATGDTANLSDAGSAVTLNLITNSSTRTSSSDANTFSGIETYILTSNDDTIILNGSSNDRVFAGSGNDDFLASSGDDYIDGQGGTGDSISYAGASGDLVISLGTTGSTGSVTGYGTDTLISIEELTAGSGNDLIRTINGIDSTVDGGGGTNHLSYDYIIAANITIDMNTVDGSGFYDVVVGTNRTDKAKNFYQITGGGGNDTFTATDSGHHFIGGDGNDTLTGGAGVDLLQGGNGNDTIQGGAGNDTLEGGAGTNTLTYAGRTDGIVVDLTVIGTTTAGYIDVDLASAGEKDLVQGFLNVTGSSVADNITGDGSANELRGSLGNDTIRGGGGIDTIYGGDNDDMLYGDAGADIIRDGNGNDFVYGGADNDTLFSIGGTDTFDGEGGVNTISYAESTALVNVDLFNGGGNGVGTGADAGTDTLINIDNIIGSDFADVLSGDNNNNDINGGAGNDTIFGKGGTNVLNGGSGINTLDYQNAANAVVVDLDSGQTTDNGDGSGGSDTISNFRTVNGSAFGDTFTSSSTSFNIMNGLAGDDTFLMHEFTSNTITGGTGTDTLDYITNTFASGINVIARTDGTRSVEKDDVIEIDTFSSIEIINTTNGNDTFRLDTAVLSEFTTLNGNGGSDTVELDGLLVDEGTALDSIFNDIENIDLTSASLVGMDSFDLSADDVKGITGTADTLDLSIGSGFNLNVTNGTYSLISTNVVGATTTYTFDNAGDDVILNVTTV